MAQTGPISVTEFSKAGSAHNTIGRKIATVQTSHFFLGGVAGGEDEDGYRLTALPRPQQHIHARQATGQAEVKHDQFDGIVAHCMLCGNAVVQPVDRKTALAQTDGEAVTKFGVIFNQQDVHR